MSLPSGRGWRDLGSSRGEAVGRPGGTCCHHQQHEFFVLEFWRADISNGSCWAKVKVLSKYVVFLSSKAWTWLSLLPFPGWPLLFQLAGLGSSLRFLCLVASQGSSSCLLLLPLQLGWDPMVPIQAARITSNIKVSDGVTSANTLLSAKVTYLQVLKFGEWVAWGQERRSSGLLQELRKQSARVLCLQECETAGTDRGVA